MNETLIFDDYNGSDEIWTKYMTDFDTTPDKDYAENEKTNIVLYVTAKDKSTNEIICDNRKTEMYYAQNMYITDAVISDGNDSVYFTTNLGFSTISIGGDFVMNDWKAVSISLVSDKTKLSSLSIEIKITKEDV